jgi:hypothetical protein
MLLRAVCRVVPKSTPHGQGRAIRQVAGSCLDVANVESSEFRLAVQAVGDVVGVRGKGSLNFLIANWKGRSTEVRAGHIGLLLGQVEEEIPQDRDRRANIRFNLSHAETRIVGPCRRSGVLAEGHESDVRVVVPDVAEASGGREAANGNSTIAPSRCPSLPASAATPATWWARARGPRRWIPGRFSGTRATGGRNGGDVAPRCCRLPSSGNAGRSHTGSERM